MKGESVPLLLRYRLGNGSIWAPVLRTFYPFRACARTVHFWPTTKACMNLLGGVSFDNDQTLMKNMCFEKFSEHYTTTASALAGFYVVNQYKEAWRLKNVAEEELRVSRCEADWLVQAVSDEKAVWAAERAKAKATEESLSHKVADLEAELIKARDAENLAREEAVANYKAYEEFKRYVIGEAKGFLTQGFQVAQDLVAKLYPETDLSFVTIQEAG